MNELLNEAKVFYMNEKKLILSKKLGVNSFIIYEKELKINNDKKEALIKFIQEMILKESEVSGDGIYILSDEQLYKIAMFYVETTDELKNVYEEFYEENQEFYYNFFNMVEAYKMKLSDDFKPISKKINEFYEKQEEVFEGFKINDKLARNLSLLQMKFPQGNFSKVFLGFDEKINLFSEKIIDSLSMSTFEFSEVSNQINSILSEFNKLKNVYKNEFSELGKLLKQNPEILEFAYDNVIMDSLEVKIDLDDIKFAMEKLLNDEFLIVEPTVNGETEVDYNKKGYEISVINTAITLISLLSTMIFNVIGMGNDENIIIENNYYHIEVENHYDNSINIFDGSELEEKKNEKEVEVPSEYKSALKSAETYSTMNMSKKEIYYRLISQDGEQFAKEEAQYAVDNLKVDYKENALKSAKIYQAEFNMSPTEIWDQSTSEYSEQFTQEEADYAIKNSDK